jgi:hypothetical protein
MANRIVNRVYIIESSTIALEWPAAEMKVSAIALWSTDTTGILQLSYVSNTSNIAVLLQNPENVPSTQIISFGQGQWFEALRVQNLTAGTGWIYFV